MHQLTLWRCIDIQAITELAYREWSWNATNVIKIIYQTPSLQFILRVHTLLRCSCTICDFRVTTTLNTTTDIKPAPAQFVMSDNEICHQAWQKFKFAEAGGGGKSIHFWGNWENLLILTKKKPHRFFCLKQCRENLEIMKM